MDLGDSLALDAEEDDLLVKDLVVLHVVKRTEGGVRVTGHETAVPLTR
ncbi:MAG: hypothetical protein R3F14_28465 [Polyangiaceae bacterium]